MILKSPTESKKALTIKKGILGLDVLRFIWFYKFTRHLKHGFFY